MTIRNIALLVPPRRRRSAYRRCSPSNLWEVVRKYHYHPHRPRSLPAMANLISCVNRSGKPVHHLVGLSVLAPPHSSLRTRNEVPVTMYIQFSKCGKGTRAVDDVLTLTVLQHVLFRDFVLPKNTLL